MNNNWTHERIPRRADCLQWDGKNTDEILGFLAKNLIIGELYCGNEYILIKQDGCIATSIKHGIWILKGEDGVIWYYSDSQHKLMYRPIDDELERLRAFAREIIEECINGNSQSIDEDFILDIAGSHRLVATHFPDSPCGELCVCREKYGDVDFDLIGVECVRLAESLKAPA